MESGKLKHKGRISGWDDRLEYRLLVAAAFVICLAMVAMRRLTRSETQDGRGEGLFAEARAAAHAAAGYAFIA